MAYRTKVASFCDYQRPMAEFIATLGTGLDRANISIEMLRRRRNTRGNEHHNWRDQDTFHPDQQRHGFARRVFVDKERPGRNGHDDGRPSRFAPEPGAFGGVARRFEHRADQPEKAAVKRQPGPFMPARVRITVKRDKHPGDKTAGHQKDNNRRVADVQLQARLSQFN